MDQVPPTAVEGAGAGIQTNTEATQELYQAAAQTLNSGVDMLPESEIDPFLVDVLAGKDRLIVLKLEAACIRLLKEDKSQRYEAAGDTSYHRLIAHRVADHYHLGHVMDEKPTGEKKVILYKTEYSRLAPTKLSSVGEETKEQASKPKVLLRRKKKEHNLSESHSASRSPEPSDSDLERREEEYNAIRAKIFSNDHSGLEQHQKLSKKKGPRQSNALAEEERRAKTAQLLAKINPDMESIEDGSVHQQQQQHSRYDRDHHLYNRSAVRPNTANYWMQAGPGAGPNGVAHSLSPQPNSGAGPGQYSQPYPGRAVPPQAGSMAFPGLYGPPHGRQPQRSPQSSPPPQPQGAWQAPFVPNTHSPARSHGQADPQQPHPAQHMYSRPNPSPHARGQEVPRTDSREYSRSDAFKPVFQQHPHAQAAQQQARRGSSQAHPGQQGQGYHRPYMGYGYGPKDQKPFKFNSSAQEFRPGQAPQPDQRGPPYANPRGHTSQPAPSYQQYQQPFYQNRGHR